MLCLIGMAVNAHASRQALQQAVASTPTNPHHSAIEFETPLFSGRACVWVQGLPGAPDSLFAGRRRRSLVTVQGRFRQAVPLDDLVTGQEFSAVRNLPPAWLVNGLLLKVRRA